MSFLSSISMAFIIFSIGFLTHIEIEDRQLAEDLFQSLEGTEQSRIVSPIVENNLSTMKKDIDKGSKHQKRQVPDAYNWRTDTALSHQHTEVSEVQWNLL